MEIIQIKGITCYLSPKTAEQLRREIAEEKEAEKRHWLLWHWYARRWAMYRDEEAGQMFSDLYKDETGCRPRGLMEPEYLLSFLECRIWRRV